MSSTISLRRRAFVSSTGREKGGVRANTREWPADHRPRPAPTESASGLEHPLYTGIHFFFLNALAACDLVDSHLHLPFKPIGVGKQPTDGLLYQIVGASPSPDGKLVELRFLVLRQMNFHEDNPRVAQPSVKISRRHFQRYPVMVATTLRAVQHAVSLPLP